MTNTNQKKANKLGMPYGTANSKLRKIIMFDLLRQLNKDICYQCGKKINTINEFSIEHKEPWLNSDPSLFWDLSNITFSHLACNCGAAKSWNATQKKHPNISSYVQGCRCNECKTLNAIRTHKYRARKKLSTLSPSLQL